MSSKGKTPPKWHQVYPQGTEAGDEEAKFFIALSRSKEYPKYRSIAALQKATGLKANRVEEIINKYLKCGLVIQNPKNENMFGYWENVPGDLPKQQASLTDADKNQRIKDRFKS